MRLLSVPGAVDELEEHGIRNVQPRELVQSTGWQEHFAAVVCVFTLRSGQHGNGIAAKVFVKAAGRASATQHGVLIHGHRIVFVVEVLVELEGDECGCGWRGRGVLTISAERAPLSMQGLLAIAWSA